MLRNIARDVENHYYDPQLHGLDWAARVREAHENIDKAGSIDDAAAEIAALLDDLNDSHTVFYPPARPYWSDFGFLFQMIGDRCFVLEVGPGSDAEKKGLKRGDQVTSLNNLPLNRKTFWRIGYVYTFLHPPSSLQLNVISVSGERRIVNLLARRVLSSHVRYHLAQGIHQRILDSENGWERIKPQEFEKGDDLLIVKLPHLGFSASEVDRILGKMHKHGGVVLDLRGSQGGNRDTLERFLGGLFPNDLKIYDWHGRKETKSVSVKGRRDFAYTGRLAVLIDASSLATSELFARVVQLERRGFILGDRSGGQVMEMKRYIYKAFADFDIPYSASITDADLIMTDGKSLEHVGVEPDIVMFPTVADLANNSDPVLAKAATLVGGHLTPAEAGALFPFEWPRID